MVEAGRIDLAASSVGIIPSRERLTLGDKLAAGDAIVLPSLPAGRYRLELELTAPPQTVGASMGIDLPIPAVAGAALELALEISAVMLAIV